jgi:hypothetical protein
LVGIRAVAWIGRRVGGANDATSTPLWVRLTVALIIIGMVMYLTGYFMIEDLLALFK